MSNDAGDGSSRLSDALDDIFRRRPPDDTPGIAATDGGDVDEPYHLPEIVPATTDPRQRAAEPTAETPAVVPNLPARPVDRPAAPVSAPPAEQPTRDTPVTPPASATSNPPSSGAMTGWGDHMPTTPAPTASQLRAPGRRPRVRRVTRVVRHIDPWSTFKVALLFSAVAYVVALTSGVLLWRVADSTGTLDNVERWFTQFGWETFELKGDEIFQNAWVIGLFGVVAATGGAVLLVTLFNLVSDIVGGIRMTVLEEEVVERTISSTRRYVVRTGPSDPTASSRPATTAWSVDDEPAEPSESGQSGEPAESSDVPRSDDPPAPDWSVD